MKLGARAFLKKSGFLFEKKPWPIEKALHKSLFSQEKEKLENMWEMAKMGIHDPNSTLYLPKTPEQAAKLFSHDANRAVASMTWISNAISESSPGAVLELGCGAGFLLSYLQKVYPNFSYSGLEYVENLASVARDLTGLEIINENYLTYTPSNKYDYLICDFGWNLSDIKSGPDPHDIQDYEGERFCSGCSEAAEESFSKMLGSWSTMLSQNGQIIITGRLMSFGHVLAFLRAANKFKLSNLIAKNGWIKWKSWRETERAPALILTKSSRLTDQDLMSRASQFYS